MSGVRRGVVVATGCHYRRRGDCHRAGFYPTLSNRRAGTCLAIVGSRRRRRGANGCDWRVLLALCIVALASTWNVRAAVALFPRAALIAAAGLLTVLCSKRSVASGSTAAGPIPAIRPGSRLARLLSVPVFVGLIWAFGFVWGATLAVLRPPHGTRTGASGRAARRNDGHHVPAARSRHVASATRAVPGRCRARRRPSHRCQIAVGASPHASIPERGSTQSRSSTSIWTRFVRPTRP